MPHDAPGAAAQSHFTYAFAAPPGAAHPIVVRSDYAIEPFLRFFMINWPCRPIAGNARLPDIVLQRVAGQLAIGLTQGMADRVDALDELDGVNRLVDLLSHVAAARATDMAELHASAVLLGGKLVLFVGPSFSGKSSLALQLAARGDRLFSDDRLLVGPLSLSGGHIGAPLGIALGLTPRARLPPHPAAGKLFAEFVDRHAVKSGAAVGFLQLDGSIAANFAETAPLGAIVLPERRETGGVVLRTAGSAAANRVLLEQMHAPRVPATNFLAAVRRLTEDLPIWHLQYDNSAQAALAVKDMMAG